MSAIFNHSALVLLISWSSGISLYLTVAIVGVCGRFGWLDLPSGLETLAHPVIIALAIIAYVVEFFADKVPWIDSAWDTVHTLVRPLGAALLGFMAGIEFGGVAQTGMAVLSGAIAFDTHALKASTRAAVNTSLEPFSNIAVSSAEDASVIGLFWLFIQYPLIASIVLVLLTIVTFLIVRKLWKFFIMIFKKPEIQEGRVESGENSKKLE